MGHRAAAHPRSAQLLCPRFSRLHQAPAPREAALPPSLRRSWFAQVRWKARRPDSVAKAPRRRHRGKAAAEHRQALDRGRSTLIRLDRTVHSPETPLRNRGNPPPLLPAETPPRRTRSPERSPAAPSSPRLLGPTTGSTSRFHRLPPFLRTLRRGLQADSPVLRRNPRSRRKPAVRRPVGPTRPSPNSTPHPPTESFRRARVQPAT